MSIAEALLTALLLGIGTARMSAIVAIDKITEPLRDLIFHYFPPEDNDREGWFYQGMKRTTKDERKRQSAWDVPWWKKRWSAITARDAQNGIELRGPHFIGQLISCQKCVGVWIAAANVAALHVWPQPTIVFNVFLAAAFVSAAANHRYYR